MKTGIGYCNDISAEKSGRKIAEQALKNGNVDRADFVIAFCSDNFNHEEYFRGLKSVVGDDVPVIGGSAIGIVTNDNLSYEGFPAGALAIQDDSLKFKISSVGDLDNNEKLAGLTLGKEFSNEPEGKLLLVFYDSIKKAASDKSPPVMNASPPLLEGLEDSLNLNTPVFGAGLLGGYTFGRTKQFCGSQVAEQTVTGILLNGNFDIYYRIMHGCTPLDGIYHTITKSEGPVIYEIDGRPVVPIINEIYGNRSWQENFPVQILTLGVNYGKKYGMPKESEYINRLITGVLPDEKGIGIFEPDLEEGTEIQFMSRNDGQMIDSTKKNSIELIREIKSEGKNPVLGLYIDCAGRTALISTNKDEEAAVVQNIFNENNVPLFGFYSGVEIAPLLGKSRGLDWTGVLVVIAQEQKT